MRSGQALTHLVELQGTPTGNLTWTLVDEAGTAVSNGTIVPAAGAISLIVLVTGLSNTLGAGVLWGARDLSWSYVVNGVTIFGEYRYTLEGRVPFGVMPAGVRTKLGLGADEDLGDEEIPLLKAYLLFRSRVGSAALATVTADLDKLLIREAIESAAALELLPTLQVRVAEKESSGTNQYARGKIDWDKLEAVLRQAVSTGEVLVNPGLTPTSNGISLLLLVTPDVELFPGA